MSKTNKIMMLLACAAAVLPYAVQAQEAAAEAEVSAVANLAVPSAYVWRGMTVEDDVVLQPDFGVTKGGFYVGWWGNMTLNDDITGHEMEFTEHDITVSYATECPLTGAAVTFGLVNFDFPNIGLEDAEGNVSLVNDTREAFVTASFTDIVLAPTVTANYDFKEANGFYFNFGVSHSLELDEKVSLALAASVGVADSDWGSYYFGEVSSGFNDYSVSATLPIALCENLTLTPGVQYVGLLEDAKDAVDASADSLYYGDTEKFLGSVKLSYAF